ncbi:hypothetical protein SAMN06265222_103281 [Neorhodopirellula lusitana]|uniref:Uncharacterized protein n=2 Tax=Neorhodopirellula lusitana TaxID=445327 RepID=A0ABY1PY37_9BACT|nr:hypothetical protein [Neorhodopirellula lusitana]SMP51480.1 hypothetical protein SAMN06265222_103281 [Neorhodopirellula lusitana]
MSSNPPSDRPSDSARGEDSGRDMPPLHSLVSGEDFDASWRAALEGPSDDGREALESLVGYLNFSSGLAAPAILKAWNRVHDEAAGGDVLSGPPPFLIIRRWLEETTQSLKSEKSAFGDVSRAENIVRVLWSKLLPSYLDFHRDQLFHLEPELIFNGFFLARCAEAMLQSIGETSSIDDENKLVDKIIAQLNDYVGYRPVALLENRSCQPYENEFVRPIPLAIDGAGISAGPYRELIRRALRAITTAPPEILRAAAMDPHQLKELCLDPRAYDFDHPVNRRPNYHFGGWDERAIDSDGRYDRFILRSVTLDSLLQRVEDNSNLPADEVLEEAASVLAGTMLMASGVSGWGPGAYSSDVTLRSLMVPIANYRDEFYRWRISQIGGQHGKRLLAEAETRHQPFGAARQHLNASLARSRAIQLQHVQLARIYARMGYPDSAARQADVVSAASARLMCRIDCGMTLGLRSLRAGDLDKAIEVPEQTFDLIRRAIHCGALMDPWDILGFMGNFSLYPGIENSIHDSRLDELLYIIESLFGYIARVWSEAAARDDEAAYDQMDAQYREIAQWWRTFAAHTVESVEAADPWESYESARLVAQALRLWHRGGARHGDIAFWAPHADLFDSPRAYMLVISALLERKDFIPAQALLIHWLGQADRVGLRSGASSLPRLAERWLLQLRNHLREEPAELWPRVNKFFDYLEANAESFWSAPKFEVGDESVTNRSGDQWEQELASATDDLLDSGDDWNEDSEAGLFDAAYEDVIYRDTTDDGNDGAIFDTSGESESVDELESEVKRLGDRLDFLQALARMWAVGADVAITHHTDRHDTTIHDPASQKAGGVSEQTHLQQVESLQAWARRAVENRIGLLKLLSDVRAYKVKPAGTDNESMRSYDRRRVLRDSLMERVIETAVEMSDARRLIASALLALDHKDSADAGEEFAEDDAGAIELFSSLIAGDAANARKTFPGFVDSVLQRNLLYIPLSRGGDPVKIYVARLRERVLRHLLHWLPRRGLLAETCRLIETARQMEQRNPIGAGAVTEFDGLYRAGYRSMVGSMSEAVLHASAPAVPTESDPVNAIDRQLTETDQQRIANTLIPLLEKLTEVMLGSWLAHSQTLRLSPLEAVGDTAKWKRLVEFIRSYGDPMFTQGFLQLSNIRAVLHQGVESWLSRALEDGDDLLDDTDLMQAIHEGRVELSVAARWVSLVFESLMDHHAEYQDYNSTTTQSDRGEMIYTFLDFLRLKARYERVAWNLKPIMWTHQVLVRMGLNDASSAWRHSLNERIAAEAELYVKRLVELQQRYSMRMPTVADRLEERFVQPMTIDRMRAFVRPAMADAEANRESAAFEQLEAEASELSKRPVGVGLDLPPWLSALDEEVEKIGKRNLVSEIDLQDLITIPVTPLSLDELRTQLTTASTQGRRLPHMRKKR